MSRILYSTTYWMDGETWLRIFLHPSWNFIRLSWRRTKIWRISGNLTLDFSNYVQNYQFFKGFFAENLLIFDIHLQFLPKSPPPPRGGSKIIQPWFMLNWCNYLDYWDIMILIPELIKSKGLVWLESLYPWVEYCWRI